MARTTLSYDSFEGFIRQGGVSPESSTLVVDGPPGVGKSAFLASTCVEILQARFEKALPPYYPLAEELLAKHDAIIEENMSGGTPKKSMVGAVRRMLKDFSGKPRTLRIAYEWLDYCRTYGHPVDEILVETYNLRPAQVESTDIRGYIKDIGSRLMYMPASWMPVSKWDLLTAEASVAEFGIEFAKDHHSPLGVLVIDEPNRGTSEARQAIMQLIEAGEHRIGDYAMKSGWSIVMGANIGADYDVSQADGAFWGRCRMVTLKPDFAGWDRLFASKRGDSGHYNVHPWIRGFIKTANEFFLATDKLRQKASADEEKCPSPRDWTSLSNSIYESMLLKRLGVIDASLQDDLNLLRTATSSAVGSHAAEAFISYVKEIKENIRPEDVIDGLLAVWEGDPEAQVRQAQELAAKIQKAELMQLKAFSESLRFALMEDRTFEKLSRRSVDSLYTYICILKGEPCSHAWKMFNTADANHEHGSAFHAWFMRTYSNEFSNKMDPTTRKPGAPKRQKDVGSIDANGEVIRALRSPLNPEQDINVGARITELTLAAIKK